MSGDVVYVGHGLWYLPRAGEVWWRWGRTSSFCIGYMLLFSRAIAWFSRMDWFLYIASPHLSGLCVILIIHCYLQSSQFRAICEVNFSAVYSFFSPKSLMKIKHSMEPSFADISGQFHRGSLLFLVIIFKSNMLSLLWSAVPEDIGFKFVFI